MLELQQILHSGIVRYSRKKLVMNNFNKKTEMKLTSIDELTDEIIGKKGTKQRDLFEYELEQDLLDHLIENATKK
ncbi:MAG: hypothetical protein DRI69_02820 [Bacteroidetes bacterium]|nr:MAG: hypothetical protein DRI69_02820 [Bacteroidota bacterium]